MDLESENGSSKEEWGMSRPLHHGTCSLSVIEMPGPFMGSKPTNRYCLNRWNDVTKLPCWPPPTGGVRQPPVVSTSSRLSWAASLGSFPAHGWQAQGPIHRGLPYVHFWGVVGWKTGNPMWLPGQGINPHKVLLPLFFRGQRLLGYNPAKLF